MYTLLSYLPTVLLQTPYTQYVKERIFDPLGLSSTTFFGKVATGSGNMEEGISRDHVNRTEDLFGQGILRSMPYWIPVDGNDGSREFVNSPLTSLAQSFNYSTIWCGRRDYEC